MEALSFSVVLVLFLLALAWIGSGLVGVWRWARADRRVPRASVRGGWPGLRPGLGEPLLRVVLGGLVVGGFVWVVWVMVEEVFAAYGRGS